MFVWNKISTQSYSAKFLYWGDHVNSVPDLAASPPWMIKYYVEKVVNALPCLHVLSLLCVQASVQARIQVF